MRGAHGKQTRWAGRRLFHSQNNRDCVKGGSFAASPILAASPIIVESVLGDSNSDIQFNTEIGNFWAPGRTSTRSFCFWLAHKARICMCAVAGTARWF